MKRILLLISLIAVLAMIVGIKFNYKIRQKISNLAGTAVVLLPIKMDSWGCRVIYDKEVDKISPKKDYILINGGYFNSKNEPDALLCASGQIVSPVSDKAIYSAIFTAANGQYQIFKSNILSNPSQCDVALQSGPLLVEINGVVGVHDNENKYPRTAIGIRGDEIIIISTNEIGLVDLANILVKNNVSTAINLDGGPSVSLKYQYKGKAHSQKPDAHVPYYLLFYEK